MDAAQDQAIEEFANEILIDNQDILMDLSAKANDYALNGDTDALYILVKAITLTLSIAQDRMKNTLGINPSNMN